MTNVAVVIVICLVCVVYLYGVDYLLDLTDKEMNRILKCEKERRISAMAETKREIYIRKIEEILRHENMAICHEAFFSEDVISNILELLKEEPEREKGEWILKKELVPLPWDSVPLDWDNYDEKTHSVWKEYYHCSNCDWKSGEFKGGNFCPNCGADMRGE